MSVVFAKVAQFKQALSCWGGTIREALKMDLGDADYRTRCEIAGNVFNTIASDANQIKALVIELSSEADKHGVACPLLLSMATGPAWLIENGETEGLARLEKLNAELDGIEAAARAALPIDSLNNREFSAVSGLSESAVSKLELTTQERTVKTARQIRRAKDGRAKRGNRPETDQEVEAEFRRSENR